MESHPGDGSVPEQVFQLAHNVLLIATVIFQLLKVRSVPSQHSYRFGILIFHVHVKPHVEVKGVVLGLASVVVAEGKTCFNTKNFKYAFLISKIL